MSLKASYLTSLCAAFAMASATAIIANQEPILAATTYEVKANLKEANKTAPEDRSDYQMLLTKNKKPCKNTEKYRECILDCINKKCKLKKCDAYC